MPFAEVKPQHSGCLLLVLQSDPHDHRGLYWRKHNSAVCIGVPTLLIEKFSGSVDAVTSADDGTVVLSVGTETYRLERTEATALCDELQDALHDRTEFTHTVCVHRPDGSYVVKRRGADSTGHSKVFDQFEQCRQLYDRLPETFTATDVEHTGVTGGRRHMLVWHFVEHDAFDCELRSRQPLTARKRSLPPASD